MPLLELSTALVAAGSSVVVPFMNKALEKTAARVGEGLDAQLVSLFTKAHHLLVATGREAQAVEPKVMVPLVQAARLETDETLEDKWAALLANAADPACEIVITPMHADILRLLTPPQAQLLDTLFAAAHVNFMQNSTDSIHPVRQRADITSRLLDMGRIFALGAGEELRKGPEQYLAQEQRFDALVDGLLRQQLIGFALEEAPKPKTLFGTEYKPGRRKAFFTLLGYDFMLACSPPKSHDLP